MGPSSSVKSIRSGFVSIYLLQSIGEYYVAITLLDKIYIYYIYTYLLDILIFDVLPLVMTQTCLTLTCILIYILFVFYHPLIRISPFIRNLKFFAYLQLNIIITYRFHIFYLDNRHIFLYLLGIIYIILKSTLSGPVALI